MNARLRLAVVIILALLGAIYLPDLGHGFVKDDYGWIAASRVQSLPDLVHLFTANVGFYRPLVSTTFAVDHALWGLNPEGYALTNVALLLADTVLLLLLARRLRLPPAAALFGVAVWVFNFHGVNMAVLWIQPRPLWTSPALELGWAPHGGATRADRRAGQVLIPTAP